MTDTIAPCRHVPQRWSEQLEDINRMILGDNANVKNRSLRGEGRVVAVWGSLKIEEPGVTKDQVREALETCKYE